MSLESRASPSIQQHIDDIYALFGAPSSGSLLWRDLTLPERNVILSIANVRPRHAGLKLDDLKSFSGENRRRILKTIRMLNDICSRFYRLANRDF